MRRMKISQNDVNLNFKLQSNVEDARFFDNIIVYGGDLDYEKLKNKPTLNGKEIVGNMTEADPQVPPWAKEEEVPVEPIPEDVVNEWLNTDTSNTEQQD